MRYVRTFNEFEDFLASQESVSGTGKYVEDIFPGFAYVKENYPEGKYAFFNGHDSGELEFGDVIYYDGNQLKSVYWSAYTPSMGTKVGLVIAPADVMADGNARMIAFDESYYQAGGDRSGESTQEVNESPLLGAAADGTIGKNPDLYWYDFAGLGGNWSTYVPEKQTFYDGVNAYYSTGSSPVVSSVNPMNLQEMVLGAGETRELDSSGEVVKGGVCIIDYDRGLQVSSNQTFMPGPLGSPVTNPDNPNESYLTGFSFAPGIVSPYTADYESDPYFTAEVATAATLDSGGIVEIRGKAEQGETTYYNITSDISGRTWTQLMVNDFDEWWNGNSGGEVVANSSNPAILGAEGTKKISGGSDRWFKLPHEMCSEYTTIGTNAGDWYLPSFGEIAYMTARANEIDNIMKALNGTDLTTMSGKSQFYYTSSLVYGYGGGAPKGSNSKSITSSSYIYPYLLRHAVQETPDGLVSFWASGLLSSDIVNNNSNYTMMVRPFAMIDKDGIVKETGNYEAVNGHRVIDLQQNGYDL